MICRTAFRNSKIGSGEIRLPFQKDARYEDMARVNKCRLEEELSSTPFAPGCRGRLEKLAVTFELCFGAEGLMVLGDTEFLFYQNSHSSGQFSRTGPRNLQLA